MAASGCLAPTSLELYIVHRNTIPSTEWLYNQTVTSRVLELRVVGSSTKHRGPAMESLCDGRGPNPEIETNH